jgi:hypothetical protein
LREVDPVSCTLTGKSTVAKRTPDATFGLATFSKSRNNPSVSADELSRERLEKLLLHRKCGLLADPKWGETDLVFPFAAYEAKDGVETAAKHVVRLVKGQLATLTCLII